MRARRSAYVVGLDGKRQPTRRNPELLPGQLAPTVDEAGPGPPPRPKLRRSERIPDPRRWRDVIPPVLAEQVADSEPLAAHHALAERVEAATAKLAELRARARPGDRGRQAGRAGFRHQGPQVAAADRPRRG
jgi:hypothetical protein